MKWWRIIPTFTFHTKLYNATDSLSENMTKKLPNLPVFKMVHSIDYYSSLNMVPPKETTSYNWIFYLFFQNLPKHRWIRKNNLNKEIGSSEIETRYTKYINNFLSSNWHQLTVIWKQIPCGIPWTNYFITMSYHPTIQITLLSRLLRL